MQGVPLSEYINNNSGVASQQNLGTRSFSLADNLTVGNSSIQSREYAQASQSLQGRSNSESA